MKNFIVIISLLFITTSCANAQHYLASGLAVTLNGSDVAQRFFSVNKPKFPFKEGVGGVFSYTYRKDSSKTDLQLSINYNYCPVNLNYSRTIDYSTQRIIGDFKFYFLGLNIIKHWKLYTYKKYNFYLGCGVSANLKTVEKSTAQGYTVIRRHGSRDEWHTTNERSNNISNYFLGYTIHLKYEYALNNNYSLLLSNQYQGLYNLKGVNVFSPSINIGIAKQL